MAKISIGDQVSIDRLRSIGWYIDAYDKKTETLTYLSPDGKLNAVFTDGCDYGVVGKNK
jgi:hypothetical protein